MPTYRRHPHGASMCAGDRVTAGQHRPGIAAEGYDREYHLPLSLQSYCFMVARNLMRIIINNEISLIIIFRDCYNNISLFLMLAKNINIFPKKNIIFEKNNNISNNIFLKI